MVRINGYFRLTRSVVGTFSVTQASEVRAGKLPVLCRKGYVPSSVLGVAALVP